VEIFTLLIDYGTYPS